MESFEMNKFLEYICPESDPLIEAMSQYAKKNYVPIIRMEMKRFLEVLVMIYRPKRILEIGTAIGYSSIVMAQSLQKFYGNLDGVEIITLERNDAMYQEAVQNVEKSEFMDTIKIQHGEAEDLLQELRKSGQVFDMVFMDAAKGQYLTFLPYCLELLKVNGLLVSDNVLQNGDIARSRFNVDRRQRTIHQRMRQYLWELNHRKDLQTSIIDIADGVTLSIKLQ